MSVQIESLYTDALPSSEGDVWTVPASKSAIVKNIRLVNTSTSAAATIKLYIKKGSGTQRAILPIDVSLPPKLLLIDDDELTMTAGDKIRGVATGATVEIVISGILREVI